MPACAMIPRIVWRIEMTTSLRVLLLALAIAALTVMGSGCGGTKNVATNGNFVIALSGFGSQIGRTFFLKVVDVASGATVGLGTPTTIATEGFSLNLLNIISSGRDYRVDFWVDVDGNGILDRSPNGTPAGVDQSWRLTGTGGSSGLALTFSYDTNFQDITPF
jgi:uncharacterized protein (DUF2141 family)